MATATNNTQNVSVTKGVEGGYFFSAPAGTALPTDYSTTLNAAFVNLGFIGPDGISETVELNSDPLTDAFGSVIGTASSGRTETIKLKLVEVKKDTLAEIYGHSNVVDQGGTIRVDHKAGGYQSRVYVLELLLKDGRKWRQIITNGEVTEIGDLSLASSEMAGREITITAAVNTDGISVIDYIQSTETNA